MKLVSCLLLLSFIIAPSIQAKSLSFSVDTNQLVGDRSLMVTASSSGFEQDEVIYIKGAFFKEGSSNYFGLTKNGDQWIKNSQKTLEQRKVTLSDWNYRLEVKTDPTDTGFPDSGLYQFKIGYYVLNENSEPQSVKWSETTVAVDLVKPTIVPTPTPTSKPTVAPKPTSTPKPTLIPKPTSTPKPLSFVAPTMVDQHIEHPISPTVMPNKTNLSLEDDEYVLGTEAADFQTTTASGQPLNGLSLTETLTQPDELASKPFPIISLFLAMVSIVAATGSLFFIWKQVSSRKDSEIDEFHL